MPVAVTPGGVPYSGFFQADFNVDANLLNETTVSNLILSESLLSPSLESTITFQAPIHTIPVKNYDQFRGCVSTFTVANPNINSGEKYVWNQKVYRMEKRSNITNGLESFVIRSCHSSLLKNFGTKISKFYKCETPSSVVSEAMNCCGITLSDIQESNPPRDYFAANLYPFQVIAEQSDVAIDGSDPSFLHYMTYLNGGTHHFRSIKSLAAQASKWTFTFAEEGLSGQLGNPNAIISFEFPCDFDLLTDIMNGIDENGVVHASKVVVNPFNGVASVVGGNIVECGGMGSILNTEAETDKYSTEENCGVQLEDYTSLRQARLALLQPDKIMLRINIPFNPTLHVGDKITTQFYSKLVQGELDYGSGDYLIVNLSHNIKSGGYGITTLECVSRSTLV